MKPLQLRETLVDLAYDRILDGICEGTLKPGERLTQEEIAERLNVSRQPISTALTMLKADGFLCDAGRRGLAVAPIDPAFFKEIYQFRMAVEALAVQLATPRLDAEGIAQGEALVAAGKDAAARHDSRALLKADMEFHAFIYECANNRLVTESMRRNWQHLRRAMGEVLREPDYPARVWREHEAILAAMATGDAEQASALVRDHLELAYRRVEKALVPPASTSCSPY